MEVFSQNHFPAIKGTPYPITLGPHANFWFVLRPQPDATRAAQERIVPTLSVAPNLQTLLNDGRRAQFEREILPTFIRGCRWFGAKARAIRELRIIERVPLKAARILVRRNHLRGWKPETLPRADAHGEQARRRRPRRSIARFAGGEEAVLHDAIWDAAFREQLSARSERTSTEGRAGACARRFAGETAVPTSQVLIRAEQFLQCSSRTNFS